MAHKAPGKSHRKGLTLAELFRMFPDDETAERWFADQRWSEGTHCPYCGSTNVQSGAKHKTMPYRCREKECAKRFSVRTKTPMESSKLGFQVWAVALYQVTTNLKGVSSMKLHRDLGITQRSAWFLAHRLREAWKDQGSQFTGPVEVDETYIGGKRKEYAEGEAVSTDRAGNGWKGHRRWCEGSCHEPRQRGGRLGNGYGFPTGLHRSPCGGWRQGLHGRSQRLSGNAVQPRDGEPFSRRICSWQSAHQWDRELLGHLEAGAQGNLPSFQREASRPLCDGIRGSA